MEREKTFIQDSITQTVHNNYATQRDRSLHMGHALTFTLRYSY